MSATKSSFCKMIQYSQDVLHHSRFLRIFKALTPLFWKMHRNIVQIRERRQNVAKQIHQMFIKFCQILTNFQRFWCEWYYKIEMYSLRKFKYCDNLYRNFANFAADFRESAKKRTPFIFANGNPSGQRDVDAPLEAPADRRVEVPPAARSRDPESRRAFLS